MLHGGNLFPFASGIRLLSCEEHLYSPLTAHVSPVLPVVIFVTLIGERDLYTCPGTNALEGVSPLCTLNICSAEEARALRFGLLLFSLRKAAKFTGHPRNGCW
jgi:hypothetical protein